MRNLVKELQRLAKNLANIETNNNNTIGVLHELNDALENELVAMEPLILEFATTDPYTVVTPLSEIKVAIDAGRQVWFMYNDSNFLLTDYAVSNNEIIEMYFGSDGYISYDGSWNIS